MAGFDTSAFTEEAYELLAELESSLLELEENPTDKELIGRVFRAMHTIKGSGAMYGFDAVSAFTHEVETVFDMVRNDEMPVTKPLIDLTLAARDHIRVMLDAATGKGEAIDEENGRRIITGLKQLTPAAQAAQVAGHPPQPAKGAPAVREARTTSGEHTWRIRVTLQPNIFSIGANPMLLLRELLEMGEAKVFAHTGKIPTLHQMDPTQCYASWDIFLTTAKDENAIRDVFIFVEEYVTLDIRMLDDQEMAGGEPKRLGEILVQQGALRADALETILSSQKPLGKKLVEAGLVDSAQVEAALTEQNIVRQKQQKSQASDASASIRIPAERLDVLVNLVGELVTVQARLTQTAGQRDDHNLLLIAEEVERLTMELRDNTMGIRMLPIGTTFNKFKRLVRDLSVELGKSVEMTTDGAETELDKTVIDQLNDPLVHIIRNSMDHGIEEPRERVAAGKPAQGTVHLAAMHSGANVLIKIADDGKGLDVERIRKKAVERGLIAADAELADKEVFNLIFAPGFSTAQSVTSLSGRGVGMDVVKRSIDALRGAVDVMSVPGRGTTITLKLPLTLAIIEGLLVQIAGDYYVLPLSSVEECVELTRADIHKAHGRHVINVRGELIPYIRLRERFLLQEPPPEIEQIVIAEIAETRIGFVVDHVIGQHQTVIKTLGKNLRDVEEFSGATILGDGTVALIVDVQKMAHFAEQEEVRSTHRLGAA